MAKSFIFYSLFEAQSYSCENYCSVQPVGVSNTVQLQDHEHKEAIRCCRFFLNVFGRIIWVFLSTGIWVYPLLGLFSTSGLVGFFIFNMSVVTLLYVLGEKLNHHVWSKNLATNKELHGRAVMSLLHWSLVLCCREESAQTFGWNKVIHPCRNQKKWSKCCLFKKRLEYPGCCTLNQNVSTIHKWHNI